MPTSRLAGVRDVPSVATDTLEGRNFILRVCREDNLPLRYVAWLQDPDVTRFLEIRHRPQSLETALAFVRSFDGPAEKYMWVIVARDSGEPIGTCTLYDVNRMHGSAEIGLMIGERAYWGSGASSEVIGLLADFAFDTLGLRRLTGGSYATNRGMNFTYRMLGFTREGQLREAFKLDDRCVDGYRWGILAREWREKREKAGG